MSGPVVDPDGSPASEPLEDVPSAGPSVRTTPYSGSPSEDVLPGPDVVPPLDPEPSSTFAPVLTPALVPGSVLVDAGFTSPVVGTPYSGSPMKSVHPVIAVPSRSTAAACCAAETHCTAPQCGQLQDPVTKI